MPMFRNRGFFHGLGGYLFRHPVDAFLEMLVYNTWLCRIVVGAIVALAFYWQASWRTIAVIVGVWVAFEALYYALRYLTRSWRL
jgi:hypothetical protein